MNAILDIFVVVLFVVCVYFGYRNGFVRTIMGVVSFIIAFITAKMFSPQFSEFIYVRYIKPTFVNKIIEDFASVIGEKVDTLNLDNIIWEVPKELEKGMTNLLSSYGSDINDIQVWSTDAAAKGNINVNDFIADKLVSPLAENISYFLAFAAIFLGVLIICRILTALINGIVKLPGLNFLNRTGGTLLGALYGVIWAYIFVFLASLVLPYLVSQNIISSASEVINNTIVFKWLYENLPFDLDKIIF